MIYLYTFNDVIPVFYNPADNMFYSVSDYKPGVCGYFKLYMRGEDMIPRRTVAFDYTIKRKKHFIPKNLHQRERKNSLYDILLGSLMKEL